MLIKIERFLLALLLAYFCVSFSLYIYRLSVIVNYPYELSKGEGIILNETIKLINGQPIYTDINQRPYLIANYPPLYQLCCAAAMKLGEPRTLFTGRLISSLASVYIGLLIFFIVFKKSGSKLHGLVGALIFFSFWYVYDWSPYYRVDMLGVLFGFIGLCWVEKYFDSNAVYISVLFFTAAFFTKQSLVLAQAAAVIYLFTKNRQKSAILASLLILMGVLIFWAVDINTKGEFHRHMLLSFGGQFRWDVTLNWLKNFVLAYPVFIALALYGAYKLAADRDISVYSIYFFLALIPALGVGKRGAYANYYVEISLAAAILSGIALKYVFKNPGTRLGVITLFFLCAQLNGLTAINFDTNRLSITRKPEWSYIPVKTDYENGDKLVGILKGIDGQGFSETYSGYFLLAGKEVEYHSFLPFYIPSWNTSNFLNDIRSGRYSFILSGRYYAPAANSPSGKDFESEKTGLISQLYKVKDKVGNYYVYVRK